MVLICAIDHYLDICHSDGAAEMDIDGIPVCIINIVPEHSAVRIICSPGYIIAESECYIFAADFQCELIGSASVQCSCSVQLLPVVRYEVPVIANSEVLSSVKLHILLHSGFLLICVFLVLVGCFCFYVQFIKA